MTNETFNEPERFLIQKWAVSRQLELAMEKIRTSYTSVGKRIVAAVRGIHAELDSETVALTQHWGEGVILIGRKAWQLPNEWPSGFYMGKLRLEVLADESEEPPYLSIWFNKPEKMGIDKEAAINEVHQAAKGILSQDEMKLCKLTSDDNCALVYLIPQSRKELLEMLAEGTSQSFIDCLVGHLDVVTKFTPVLDKVFEKK
jgi:hypothetical protein